MKMRRNASKRASSRRSLQRAETLTLIGNPVSPGRQVFHARYLSQALRDILMPLCALCLCLVGQTERGFPLFETRPRFVLPFVFPPPPRLSARLPPKLPSFTSSSSFFLRHSHYTSFGRRPPATGYFNWISTVAFFVRSYHERGALRP